MFSKQESTSLRKEFWTCFGKSFPRKWLLYNTKIKGLSFKFVANRKNAMICLDIEHADEMVNKILFDKILSLKTILKEDYVPEVIFDDSYILENGKSIHRIYINHREKFSIYNKDSWNSCYEFYIEIMPKFELFFYEYRYLPIAIIILPQFASSPAIAVLTKGELATENAIFFADFVEEAPSNFMVINLEAPSPSITIN